MTEFEREDAPLVELIEEALREVSALHASVSRRQSGMRSEQLRLRTVLAEANFALERLASTLDMVALELSQPKARVREVVARWGGDGAALTELLTRLLAGLEKAQQYIGVQRLRKKALLEKQMDRLDLSAGRICVLRDQIDASQY